MYKKAIILGVFCSVILTGCGVADNTGTIDDQSFSAPQIEADTNSESERITDEGSDNVIEEVAEESNNESEAIDNVPEAQSIHKKIDSDIMEMYGMQIAQKSEDRLVYNDEGYLIKVLTTNNDGSERSQYEFDYDATGRVSEAREYGGSEPSIIARYERDSQGRKTRINFGNGYREIVYDSNGNREFDYWYMSDGTMQDSYYAYIYDNNGNRVEFQNRATGTDEVLAYEKYEYDEQGRIIAETTYTFGNFTSRKEFTYNAEGFDYLTIYADESLQDGIMSPTYWLSGNLYEVQDY